MMLSLAIMVNNFPKYQVGVTIDDAEYIILARSLVSGNQFRLINYPADPPTSHYPFGFPLLLAPFAAIFPTDLSIYKILSILATLVNATLIFWGWRLLTRKYSYWWGLGVTALYLFSLTTIDLSGRVMSEPVFLTFYLMAMLLAERRIAGGVSRWWSLWMAVALLFVLYIRSIGIVLVISILGYLIILTGRRFYQWLLPTLAIMAILLGLLVMATPLNTADLFRTNYLFDRNAEFIVYLTSIFKSSTEKELQLGPGRNDSSGVKPSDDNARNLGDLLYDYVYLGVGQHIGLDLRSALSPLPGTDRERAIVKNLGVPFLTDLISYLFAIIVILGFALWFKNDRITIFNFSSVIYFFTLFLWLWAEPRFLYPILPQLITGLLMGVQGILFALAWLVKRSSNPARSKYVAGVLALFTILFSALFIYKGVQFADSRLHVGIIGDRVAWIKENTPLDAIIMTEYPVLDHLYSDRKTIKFPTPGVTTSEFCQYLADNQVEYILVASKVKWMQPSYQPEYSERMQIHRVKIGVLASQGNLQSDYSSELALLRIYRVRSIQRCPIYIE